MQKKFEKNIQFYFEGNPTDVPKKILKIFIDH